MQMSLLCSKQIWEEFYQDFVILVETIEIFLVQFKTSDIFSWGTIPRLLSVVDIQITNVVWKFGIKFKTDSLFTFVSLMSFARNET